MNAEQGQVIFSAERARVFRADHRRQAKAARENCRVRCRATQLGDESCEVYVGAIEPGTIIDPNPLADFNPSDLLVD